MLKQSRKKQLFSPSIHLNMNLYIYNQCAYIFTKVNAEYSYLMFSTYIISFFFNSISACFLHSKFIPISISIKHHCHKSYILREKHYIITRLNTPKKLFSDITSTSKLFYVAFMRLLELLHRHKQI